MRYVLGPRASQTCTNGPLRRSVDRRKGARGEEGCCGVATHARGVPAAAAAAPAAGRHSREGRSKTGRDVRLTSLRVRRFARGEARLHVCVYAASAAAPAGFRLRRWRLTADRRRAYGEPPRALSHCPGLVRTGRFLSRQVGEAIKRARSSVSDAAQVNQTAYEPKPAVSSISWERGGPLAS